ncbi:MAG: hypothetical protein ABFR62_09305 [Bacteroidota bacterium]
MEKQISIGLRNTFIVHGTIMSIIALIFLSAPIQWGSLTGAMSEEVPQIYTILGATILGYAISSFLAIRESSWEKVKIIVQMECIISIIFPFVLLFGILLLGLPQIAWLFFVVMSGFTIAFNFFYFKELKTK